MNEQQIQNYHKKVNENIERFGYHTTYVQESETSPSFCYSTGIFKSFNIPELFISSLGPNLSSELIKNYVAAFQDGKNIPIGDKIDFLTDRFPIYLIEVPKQKLQNYVLSSIRFYNSDKYKYLQLIYPDINGLFPNEIGYDYDQEILGNF